MLGLTFANEADYDLIKVDDTFNFTDLAAFTEGKQLTLETVHADGTTTIVVTPAALYPLATFGTSSVVPSN